MAELEARLARVERERDEYRKLYLLVREEIEQLKRGLIGQKAHRAPKDDSQLSLAILDLALGIEEAVELPTELVAAHERRKAVRKPLPEQLPRVTMELVPPGARGARCLRRDRQREAGSARAAPGLGGGGRGGAQEVRSA